MKPTDFTKRLKEVRDKLGFTQKVLAEKLGCSRASYAYYETNKNTPDINFIKTLHELSGYPLDYLLGYTDNFTTETAGLDIMVGLSTESIEAIKSDRVLSGAINLVFAEAVKLEKEAPVLFPGYDDAVNMIVAKGLVALSFKMHFISQNPEQFFAEEVGTDMNNKQTIDMKRLAMYLGYEV